ncbi:MAG: glycosyltransferase [Eubacteriales bacterium]
MIRVLQYGLSSNEGGIENVFLTMNKEINKDKITFDYIIAGDVLAYEEKFKLMGSKIYKIEHVRHNPIKRFKIFYNFFKNNSTQFDIIHCSYNTLYSIEPIILARLFKIKKIVVHAHSSGHYSNKKINHLFHRINKMLVPLFATDFVACSEVAGNFCFPNRCRKSIIYNPLDIDKFKFNDKYRLEIRNEFCVGDELVIGHVGAFLPVKNQKFLVVIFSKVKMKVPNAKLIFVGDGYMRSQVKSLVDLYGLQDDVIFTGIRNDVNKILSAMDIFVFPSLYEGFAIALAESQASGLICIASDTITREVALDRLKINFVSLNANADRWAEIIISKMNKGNRIIDNGRFKVLSVDSQVQKYEDIYLN